MVEDEEEPDDRTIQEYLEDEVIPLIDPWDKTRYPVIAALTEYRVMWVDGDSPQDALERIRQDGDWYERLDRNSPAIDCDVSFEPPDPHQWVDTYFGNGVYTDEHGPLWACPHCGHRGQRARNVIHKPECPDRPTR